MVCFLCPYINILIKNVKRNDKTVINSKMRIDILYFGIRTSGREDNFTDYDCKKVNICNSLSNYYIKFFFSNNKCFMFLAKI